MDIIQSLGIDYASGKVLVTLKLNKDYRKAKMLITNKLKNIHWVNQVKVEMAPKQ